MSDSVRPHRRQPTRLPRPWDSPGKNTGVGGHFLLQCMKVKSESEAAQSCPTLRDPIDCSPSGSSIHGIFQARVLEWGKNQKQPPRTNTESLSKSTSLHPTTGTTLNHPSSSCTGILSGNLHLKQQSAKEQTQPVGQQRKLSVKKETVKDREAWHAAACRVTKSRTQLSN